MSTEEDSRSEVDARYEVLGALKKFEDQLLTLVDGEYEDTDEETGEHIPEILEEQKEDLRLSFYTELRGLFLKSPTEGRVSPALSHQSVFLLISDRLNRSAGYYQALLDAQEEVRKRNIDIGDPKGLIIDLNNIQNLLASLDEVDFVRNVGLSMGLDPDDLNKIVEFIIRKEFAPIRK